MNPKDFTHWIDRVYATKDDELDCNQVQALLPAYAEAKVNDAPFNSNLARDIEAHLIQCAECDETAEAIIFVLLNDPLDEADLQVEPASTRARLADEITPVSAD